MKIFYGVDAHHIDVTDICLSKLTNNNVITIPAGDGNRSNYFSDPLCGVVKKIIININDDIQEYADRYNVKIDTNNNTISYEDVYLIETKLQNIHSSLILYHGSFYDELPEQKMAVRYIKGNEKVLEIGGNIGRNSLIIASLLNYSNNLVTLEMDNTISTKLEENRDLNNLSFFIEKSALSNRRLIYQQGAWETQPSDVLLDGFCWANTITWEELNEKYNIEFDTLVLDCEGAFYYILMDIPEILKNINLIIMENDYHDITHKQYIDEVLLNNNFYRDYVEYGGWGPCKGNFFEVWKR
jgi:FkbM family methyltransferase